MMDRHHRDNECARQRHPLAFAAGRRDHQEGKSAWPLCPEVYWTGSWMQAAWMYGWEVERQHRLALRTRPCVPMLAVLSAVGVSA